MSTEGGASWAQVWEQLRVRFGIYAVSPGPSFSPPNILANLALCLVLWLIWKPSRSFLAWVFPAKVYRTRSFLLDLWLFLLNWFIGLFTALNYAAIATVTAYRHHPIYHILTGLFVSVAVGLCQTLAMVAFIGRLDVAVLAGTNVFSALLNLATNNLKHSHIRLRSPGWREHVLISPAQHQVHPSIDPRHFNCNYGDSLPARLSLRTPLSKKQRQARLVGCCRPSSP